ncbi:hypothetical protein ACIQU5_01610 [Streptomyces sp. NPDC090306]|uniref:hypothetical protein n=1 Tax=unclassified Streptomyces TaxID=2593676 RepID=UPI0036E5E6C9
MKSEDTVFEGGPLDGRVLPVLLGPTGQPPKTYRVPVPDGPGGPAHVLVYRREPRGHSARLGIPQGWKYVHDPAPGTGRSGPRWPWSKPRGTADAGEAAAPDRPADATDE